MAAIIWCIFQKKNGRLSLLGPKILAFSGHSMANFQSILDCFIPNFKLKHEDLENIKNRLCKYSRFQLTSNQTSGVFYRTPGKCYSSTHSSKSYWLLQNLSSLGCLCLLSSIITLWFDIRNFDNSLLRKKNYFYLLNRF